MNSKIKKLFSILILIVVVVSSFTYYENSTEPKGLQGVCNGIFSRNYSQSEPHSGGCGVSYLYSDNVSYLGNKADLMLWINPIIHIFDLSQCEAPSESGGYGIVCTALFISNESYAPLYSHLVISVSNFSISFNKTMFYNVSTKQGDVFGNYIELWHGSFSGNRNIYDFFLGEPEGCGPPLTKVIIPGNYTLYENITFTITVSLGILHFTSQEYSIHKSWWELWGYNV